jgi:hypothetical protein
VPHPTTLVKLTRRVGPATVAQRNQALLATAATHKVLRTHKVRADTTVVEANVCSPTDAGLLAKAVSTLAHTIGRVQTAGGATRTRVRNRRRAARRRAHQLARSLGARTGQANQQVAERTAELAGLATQAATDAARVARNARRQLDRAGGQASGKLTRLVDDLETTIGRTQQVIGQARTAWPVAPRTGPPGCVACTTLMPARSSRAGSASRSSSATRPRPPTLPTGSCWRTWSRSATPLLRPCWSRPSSGSSTRPAGCLRRRPLTGATARPPPTTSCAPWAWSGSRSLPRARPARPAKPRSTPGHSGAW